MSWYDQGEAGQEKARQDDEERKRRASGIFRFWLPVDKSAQFTFLDTAGFFFKEHQLYINGSWMNFETCIQDIGEEDCPPCEAGMKYSYVCVFTVVDHSEYVSKTTKKRVTNTKKLLVLKATARNKILKQKERREGDLTFCRYEATRFADKECSTGEDFEFIQRYTLDEMQAMAPSEWMGNPITPNEWLKPFDYMKLFNPKSAAELRRIIGMVQPVGSESSPFRGETSMGEDDAQEAPPDVSSLV